MNSPTTADERWEYILHLDDELLRGGVILSEWCTFLVRDADRAFAAGANLAAILTSQAAIEAHLRFEYPTNAGTFRDATESSPIPREMKDSLHELRRFRNRWVHVSEPGEDAELLIRPDDYEREIEAMARSTMRLLRTVIYLEQCI